MVPKEVYNRFLMWMSANGYHPTGDCSIGEGWCTSCSSAMKSWDLLSDKEKNAFTLLFGGLFDENTS